MKKKLKYASYQNHLNRKTKGYLTNEADWCKNCGGYISTVWSKGNFPMPSKEHKCKKIVSLTNNT